MDSRLKKQKDFDRVFHKGVRVYSKNLTMIFLKQESLKAGFAVSKKHGKSVSRNRIKRLLRESFRSFKPFITQNFFFVFLPKVKEEYSLAGFKKDMENLLVKSGIMRDA